MRNFIVGAFFIMSIIVLMDVASAQNIPMPPQTPPIPEPHLPMFTHMNHIAKRFAQGPQHDGGPHPHPHGGPPPPAGPGGHQGGPGDSQGESGNEMMMGSKNVAS